MPLSRQVVPVDRPGERTLRSLGSGRQPSIGASRSRDGRPPSRRYSGPIGTSPLPDRAAIWRSLPKATIAPGSWSSTFWRRS